MPLGNRPMSGLQERLYASREGRERQETAGIFNKEEFFNQIRPQAQKQIQAKFTLQELADRHSPVLRQKVRAVVLEMIEGAGVNLPKPTLINLAEELVNDLLGYGPLEPFFTGEMAQRVTEIKVLRWDMIRIEIDGKEMIATDENGRPVKFRDEQHCRDVLEKMLAPTGRRVDLSSPRVSARLPDGSRLMAHIPPVAVEGTTMSIRRFRMDMTMDKFLEYSTLNQEMADFLAACVKGRLNIIVSGGTSSGKSTFLNVLASYIPEDESIITIEDPAELRLQHSNVRRLEARPANVEGQGEITQRDLVADALRMAPKRIIVGECRKGEAFDMMQAMGTGHDGSMTTLHANSAEEAVNRRLVNMIQMADMGLPYEAILGMIADSVDLVVQLIKDRTGRRRVDHICEVTGLEKRDTGLAVGIKKIYAWNPEKGDWERTKEKFTKTDRLALYGVELPPSVN